MSGEKSTESFDIAINHGRVIDPLSGFDGEANIGIGDGVITAILPPGEKLKGKREIDAAGLVVALGFVNIHSHSTDIGKGGVELYIRDGITTEVSGNCGMLGPVSFAGFADIADKEGLVSNTAVYVGHNALRKACARQGHQAHLESTRRLYQPGKSTGPIRGNPALAVFELNGFRKFYFPHSGY